MNVVKNKETIFSVFFILIAIIIYFYKIIFFNLNYFIGDLYTQFFPWKEFLKNSIQNGKMPFWNPYTFSGEPFLADIQKGIFYPPGIVFMLFSFSFALKIYILTHFIFMGISMFFLLKKLNFSNLSSIAGTFVFIFNSFTLSKINFLSALGSISWLPFLVYTLLNFLIYKKFPFFILFIFGVSISFLSGHPPILYYSIMFLFLFWIYFLYENNSITIKNIFNFKVFIFFILNLFFVILLTLPQTGLFKEFLSFANRGTPLNYELATSYSLSFSNLFGFLMPGGINGFFINPFTDWILYALGNVNFFTITVIFLLLVSFIFPKTRLFWFCFFIIILSLLLSLGKNTPLYSIFYIFVPFFSYLRHPGFAITLLLIPLSIISAFSIENTKMFIYTTPTLFDRLIPFSNFKTFFSTIFSKKIFYVYIFFLIFILLLIINSDIIIKLYNISPFTYKNFIIGIFIFMLILGINIFSFFLKEKGIFSFNIFGFIIILFIFLESFIFLKINPTISSKIYDIKNLNIDTIKILKSSGYKIFHTQKSLKFRISSGTTLFNAQKNFLKSIPPNTSILFNLFSADGYNPLSLKKYINFLNNTSSGNKIINRKNLDILNVKFILTFWDLDNSYYYKIYDNGFLKIYRNPSALPLFFVNKYRDRFDLSMANLSWSSFENNSSFYKVNVKTKNDGFLIFSNNYYPGWTTYIDGKQTKIYECLNLYIGTFIKKGQHVVIFKYYPSHFKLFNILFYIFIFVLISLLIVYIYIYYKK